MEPSLLFPLFALAGLVVGVGLLDHDDGDDAPPPRMGEDGSPGDDLIDTYDPAADADQQLSTFEGDDTVALDHLPDTNLGDGDDLVDGGTAAGTAWADGLVQIDAGAGDDSVQLDGAHNTQVNGGSGDDLLTLRNDIALVEPGTEHVQLHGEDGNDTLSVQGMTAEKSVGGYHISLTGGAGADVFEIAPRPDAHAVAPENPKLMGYAHVATIIDFNGDEDQLVIDPHSYAGDATFSHHEITTASGTGYHEIVLHYTHPDHPEGLVLSVALYGDNKFSEGDLVILGAKSRIQ